MSVPLDRQLAYLRLARTDQIGPVTFQRLLTVYGTAEKALEALPELSQRGGRKRPLRAFSMAKAKAEYGQTDALNGRYLFWGEEGYPTGLQALPDAPPVLAAHGHSALLEKPMIAMVGARNASAAARKMTSTLSTGLAAAGLVIVSGLARGVDGAAHQAALESGTIAVIGNGAAHAYPRDNTDLQNAIIEQGLLLSENPPDTAPQASLFPRRNRIISGLSLGVIVVEAAQRSGSLITARLAGEQGREVFAVPNSPLDTRCLGSNNLLRDGAVLTETADDVLNVLRPLMEQREMDAREPLPPKRSEMTPTVPDDSVRALIIELMGPVPITIDELVEAANAPVSTVHLVLLELDLAGRLTQEPGGKISLI
ncbi:MAG: DNA-processing protein DprA [Alphaproteobacteria bacterium]|nr:DNA-processing protein DprA [Alphaproteobacteria bacterium]